MVAEWEKQFRVASPILYKMLGCGKGFCLGDVVVCKLLHPCCYSRVEESKVEFT